MSFLDIIAHRTKPLTQVASVLSSQALSYQSYKQSNRHFRRYIAVPCAVALAITASACGFEPVAAPNSMTTANAEIPLKDISIKVTARSDEERFQYLLEQELGRSVSVTSVAENQLILDIAVVREGLAIAQNDTVTRFNLTATTGYKLQSPGGDAVLEGETVSITALNATASQFTTSVSERDALKRLATDIARRVSTLLRVHYSRADQTVMRAN